jgi:hypothetical protein
MTLNGTAMNVLSILDLPDILAVDYFCCAVRHVQHTPTADTVHTTSSEHDEWASP